MDKIRNFEEKKLLLNQLIHCFRGPTSADGGGVPKEFLLSSVFFCGAAGAFRSAIENLNTICWFSKNFFLTSRRLVVYQKKLRLDISYY